MSRIQNILEFQVSVLAAHSFGWLRPNIYGTAIGSTTILSNVEVCRCNREMKALDIKGGSVISVINAIRGFACGACLMVSLGASSFAVSVADVVNLVSQTQYQHYLDDLLYTHTGDDRAYGPEHDMARNNIFDQLAAFGLQTTLEPFNYEGKTYHNVVGVLPGRGARSNEVYLISGHYDSATDDEDLGVPGADDDGSGVAGILEAARVLARFEFEATLVFVAFDREEDDMVGSTEYVAAHVNDQIKGMVALDMIANNSSANKPEICCLDLSKPLMLAVSNAVELYGEELAVSYGGAETNADHFSFESRGIQACLLFEGGKNQHYHTLEDSVDTPNYIDYQFATRMTRAAVGWMATAASLHSGAKLQVACLPDGRVKISWPTSSTKVIVQSAPDLDAESWSALPESEIETEGANSVLVQPTQAAMQFYRLVQQ